MNDYWSLKFTVYDVANESFVTMDYDDALSTSQVQELLNFYWKSENLELRRIDKIEWQYAVPQR